MTIHETVENLTKEHVELENKLRSLLKGKPIRISDKNFNGQPIGTSKPSLFGKNYTISNAFFDSRRVIIWVEEASFGLSMDQIEFLDDLYPTASAENTFGVVQ